MAISVSEANTVSTKAFDSVITQQIYEGDPFFAKMLKDKKVVDGGTQLTFNIRYQKLGTASANGARAQLSFESNETRTQGVLDWTYYDGTTAIFRDERNQSHGKAQIINLIKDKSTELTEELRDKMLRDFYATTQVVGGMICLDDIIDANDTYGGIAVADVSDFKATESTETTMALYGANSLSYMINQATFGSNKPTMHVTTRDLYSKYESLLQPQQRFQSDEMAALGFDNVMLKGAPVMGSAFVSANHWYGIDTKQFEIQVSHLTKGEGKYGVKVSKWIDLLVNGYPDSMAKHAEWIGNIVCKMRKTSFKFSALDYTL